MYAKKQAEVVQDILRYQGIRDIQGLKVWTGRPAKWFFMTGQACGVEVDTIVHAIMLFIRYASRIEIKKLHLITVTTAILRIALAYDGKEESIFFETPTGKASTTWSAW
ncbi:hypothetical protein PC129_g12361 [Phytophthora cactorum]|uniref:Uncharacterized protein n=1 Tax=Phytophthora cactorum TaxID=29920 RepID=A0A329RAF3_9STRA|nr:hypothetical protein Pcac1_g16972 [Phytophthora cactorum]KAG2771922.1 hypothetical protein Pcac1_g16974 [Phytophthora cactorum]KAG2798900.1 hypothetical protein PC111_g20655 [Phytophthora cactorum]KAG2816157.1 hypothetical protein PC112_g13565 [Phytophthora cactorum]KAG2884590.1 hypothetical protein PC114_g20015 [Phytophthora cactorum]